MKYAIITDQTVEALYGKKVSSQFGGAPIFSFPAGESSKTRATKELIEDRLLLAGYSRETTIVALGGGVVTDLAGFLASTFCRGVDLILIPTTLLGMVDASIGGKTSVNTPHAKNMIGAFYEPIQTIIDLSYLKTLPAKEMFNGEVEMLKIGLVADANFFTDMGPLETAIEKARALKMSIVKTDPYDRGVRRSLNLGHTLGHALETLSNYTLSHGEAVAAGIVLEAWLSLKLNILTPSDFEKVKTRFPPVSFNTDPDKLISCLRLDKKGKARFILLKTIGESVELEVPENLIKELLYDTALCTC